jgi:hypothetical protein
MAGWHSWVSRAAVALLVGSVALGGCSSEMLPGVRVSGTGGSPPGGGMGGENVDPVGKPPTYGSCDGTPNPDYDPGGACAPTAQSVASGIACTRDCCLPCGIDMAGSKRCTCPVPGQPYASCVCSPPSWVPAGLEGGPCVPQGYSGAVPADAPPGSISLQYVDCAQVNAVCFTANSTPASGRGCICVRDADLDPRLIGGLPPTGTGSRLHCASVNHWWVDNGVPTVY